MLPEIPAVTGHPKFFAPAEGHCTRLASDEPVLRAPKHYANWQHITTRDKYLPGETLFLTILP